MTDNVTPLTPAQIEEMKSGARNAVRNCMAVTAADRVLVLTDDETSGIGRVLYDAAVATGAQAALHRLEEYGPRPITALPDSLAEELRAFRPTVTYYAAASKPGELSFRMAFRVFVLDELHVRHAHMPGVTYRLMVEGMKADYQTISAVTHRVYDLVRVAHTIRVTTPDGTNLTAEFDPNLRWIPSAGIYSKAGQWGNLPEGETFTCPQTVNGAMVVHLLGDYFSGKYGVLKHAITIQIQDGRAVSVRSEGEDQSIAEELSAYLDSDPNGRRAGEFAIGTNVGLTALTDNLLQDEKIPGLHIAFGNPYPAETGAAWTSKVHVDVIATHCTILVDGRTLMRDGQFDYGLLGMVGPAS